MSKRRLETSNRLDELPQDALLTVLSFLSAEGGCGGKGRKGGGGGGEVNEGEVIRALCDGANQHCVSTAERVK